MRGRLACVFAAGLLAVAVGSAPDVYAQDDAVAATGMATGAGAAAATGERRQLLTRLERLREEAAATEARTRELSDALVDLAGDEARLRQQADEAAAQVAELEQRVAGQEEALERVSDEQAAIRQSLAGKRVELAAVLMALQRLGRQAPPALVGDTSGPVDAVRGAILLNALLPRLDAEARQLARALAAAARLAAEEQERWTDLRQDLARLSDERARLTALGEELERRRALSAYERDQAAADLARLAQEESSVSALLARLASAETAPPQLPEPATAFAERRGTLSPPVAGRVLSRYGDPTPGGGRAEGHTIAALPQSTVFSPMAATILFAGPFRGFGDVLILDAGDGYHMVLAGLEAAFVTVGDRVKPGAPIGRMGRSSRRSAVAVAGGGGSALLRARPALYVELRMDGVAVDSHGWWREAAADVGRTGG